MATKTSRSKLVTSIEIIAISIALVAMIVLASRMVVTHQREVHLSILSPLYPLVRALPFLSILGYVIPFGALYALGTPKEHPKLARKIGGIPSTFAGLVIMLVGVVAATCVTSSDPSQFLGLLGILYLPNLLFSWPGIVVSAITIGAVCLNIAAKTAKLDKAKAYLNMAAALAITTCVAVAVGLFYLITSPAPSE